MNDPDKNQQLIQSALATLDRLYKPVKHEVAASLRCRDGKIYSGIHIENNYSGYADVCGEVAAISMAVADGQSEFESIVAVVRDGAGKAAILAPCGRCRDILLDFGEDIEVLIGDVNSPTVIKIKYLNPHRS